MFENLNKLVTAAAGEVSQVADAEASLVAARDELAAANAVVAEKQSAVNVARESVATEKSEAIAALTAIVEAVQAEIAKLEPQS